MAGQPSTRAEWLRAVAQELKVSYTLDLECEACGGGFTPADLEAARSVRCPACRGTAWTLVAVFTDDDTANAALGLRLAGVAAGVGIGIATGYFVIPGIGGEGHVGGGLRQRFREAGVDARLLRDFLPLPPREQLDALLTFLHARELTTYQRIRELAQTEGAECLHCRQVFTPVVALERHGIQGIWPFDDATCSNACRRLAREALEARVCPVCDKAFVPPPRPAIDRDWAPKEYHLAGYCTKHCWDGRDRLHVCKGCRTKYVVPQPNPLAKHPKKPKAWHVGGFCSKQCLEGVDRFRDCAGCGKRFQIPAPSKLSKQKPKPWHLAGCCSKACRDDPQPAPAPAQVGVPRLDARCADGHTFPVPAAHQGLRTTCPECRTTVVVA